MPGQSPSRSARDAAMTIVRLLQQAGHVAYFAGGCVRDDLLGRQPQDYDVATDARPEQVRRLFRNTQYVGEAFGVVLVRLMGRAIEVATFRTEWGYQDGRRPGHVEFTDAQHDAMRRDFTINGLFEDPLAQDPEQRIIDFVGGRADLQARLIRAIGEPDERFGEDFLRMLRAVRFAVRMDFQIEQRTARAIRAHARQLGRISRERIGQEVQKMLTGPDPARAAALVQELGLDGPALNEDHQQAALAVVRGVASARAPLPTEETNPEIGYGTALAAWLLDRHLAPRVAAGPGPLTAALQVLVNSDLPALVRRWRKALALSNESTAALRRPIELLLRALSWSDLSVAARKRLLAEPAWAQAAVLLRAVGDMAGGESARTVAKAIERDAPALIAEGVAPPPLVSGDDLIALGLEPSPIFKRLLDEAYDQQLELRVRDREAALAWLRGRLGEARA